jgi:hypothetical protein
MLGNLNFEDIGKMVATVGKKTLYLSDKPVEEGMNEFKSIQKEVFYILQVNQGQVNRIILNNILQNIIKCILNEMYLYLVV